MICRKWWFFRKLAPLTFIDDLLTFRPADLWPFINDLLAFNWIYLKPWPHKTKNICLAKYHWGQWGNMFSVIWIVGPLSSVPDYFLVRAALKHTNLSVTTNSPAADTVILCFSDVTLLLSESFLSIISLWIFWACVDFLSLQSFSKHVF